MKLIIYILLLIFPVICFSQNDTIPKLDSIAVEKQDTLYFNKPLKMHGSSFLIPYKHYTKINKTDFAFENYQTSTDLIQNKLFSFPLSLGNIGKFNTFAIYGAYPQQLCINYNNRPMFDIFDRKYNLEQFPAEFFENIEILTGTDAISFSDNSSGAMLNFQEITYNTNTPFTKLWFAQADYDFIGADGIFSQNIAKDLNFTFGFRSLFSSGRYDNNWLESWNARGLLRYNISDLSSISIVYNFVNMGNGTNGGIKSDSSDFADDLSAVVLYKDLNDRVFRNEFNLTYSQILNKDTTQAFSTSLFFANEDWTVHRQDDMLQANDTLNNIYYSAPQVGINFRYEMSILKFFTIRAGTNFLHYELPETYYFSSKTDNEIAFFVHSEIKLSESFSIIQGNRWTKQNENSFISSGGKICYSNNDNLNLSLDLSYSETRNIPLFTSNLNKEKNLLLLANMELKFSKSKFVLNFYGRNVIEPIIFEPVYENDVMLNTIPKNIDSYSVFGGSINFETAAFKLFIINAQVQSNYVNSKIFEVKDLFPLFYGNLSIYYKLQIGESILNVGAKAGFISKFKGLSYVSFNRTYIYKAVESGNRFTGLDLFLSAKLGNAYIKATYQNLLSNEYYYVPLYPVLDGNLRLSLQWSFFE
ncbi:MAG TPA: hypothetical protein PKY56_02440 [Candidatus Kapabacteria bacterium]|nr:hypothetical protein [Candidatus Kapabacteria bacterium]